MVDIFDTSDTIYILAMLGCKHIWDILDALDITDILDTIYLHVGHIIMILDTSVPSLLDTQDVWTTWTH